MPVTSAAVSSPPAISLGSLRRSELAALAAIIVLGAAIGWMSGKYPARMPVWGPWRFSWSEYLATTVTLWWYARGIVLSGRGARPSWWHMLCFITGVALCYAVLQTRYDYLAQHAFFLHRAQHAIMHHLGPFLIALAWPGDMIGRGMPALLRNLWNGRPLARITAWIQRPVPGGVLFVGLVYFWLIPPLHLWAMLDYRLYALMNWTMVVDGVLFWCLLLDPRPSPPAAATFRVRILTALVIVPPQLALGLWLAFSPNELYKSYDICGRVFPWLQAREDQHIGGLITAIPTSMMSLIAFVIILDRHLFSSTTRFPSK
jgi:putative membrane protein